VIWQEIKITTTPAAADAVANLYHDLGFGGVVIEDPQLLQEYTRTAGWDCYNLPLEALQGDLITVKGYLPLDINEAGRMGEEPAVLQEFRRRLLDLWPHFQGAAGQISLSQVTEEDWANNWKQYYHPVKISDRIVVKPSWEDYRPAAGEVVIDLDPGMAFGTGTHPTTVHCLKALENYLCAGEMVIDVGTGSGILAIAAAKLGAARVLAIDLDPLAVTIAQENVLTNQVEDRVQVVAGNLLEPAENLQADIITGNLIAAVVKRLAPSAFARLKPGGIFIGAGIIQGRLDEVLEELEAQGFKLLEVTDEGEWSTVIVTRD
jgi:ribosomal protein L11 methyltransferase